MGELTQESNMAGWLEDYATDAARTGDLQKDESQDHSGVDRASAPEGRASIDPLQLILERTWGLLNRPKLHAHHCRRCSMLRPCLQQPCHFRALDCEAQWICGDCVAGEEAP